MAAGEALNPKALNPKLTCNGSRKGCSSALATLAEMKSRMLEVDPTTPRPRAFASIASVNISPGTYE